jgi:hypothetical protein
VATSRRIFVMQKQDFMVPTLDCLDALAVKLTGSTSSESEESNCLQYEQ